MTTPSSNTGTASPEHNAGWNGRLWLAALFVGWGWTWFHLSTEWRMNDQYQFGFAVPFLTAVLIWERLRLSPERFATIPPPASRWIVLGLLPLALLGLWLSELLRQQDPTWRLCGWFMGFSMTLLTGIWLRLWRGRTALYCLAFPLAFHLLILPWPSTLELRITVGLLHLVTGIVTDVLNWAGIAALQQGNLIQLSNGIIGVDIACSGIQSFQASLMAALFLGDFHRLRWAQRILLLVSGSVAAFLGNLIRTYSLATLVGRKGEAALGAYHDQVGYSVTAFTFVLIFLIAWWMQRRQKEPLAAPAAVQLPLSLRTPGRTGYVAAAWMLALPALAAGWFAITPGGKMQVQDQPFWSLSANRLPPGWQAAPVPFTAVESSVLRYTTARALTVRTAEGFEMEVNHFFWAPNVSVPSVAFAHTPDICMPSSGWVPLKAPEPLTLTVRGHTLAGAQHRFGQEERVEGVFHVLWNEESPTVSRFVASRFRRFALLWDGPRKRGHEMLLIFFHPVTNDNGPQLTQALNQVLVPGTNAPAAKPAVHP